MSDLLAGQNYPQQMAITTRSNAALVLAGAGSGKTGVLTRRIAYLIAERGVSPYNILALTFTRKAAQEMKERLAKLLDEKTVRKLWVGTFHSISLRILETHGKRLGYQSHISIYDEIDQEDIVTAIIDELGANISPRDVLREMNQYAADCDRKFFIEPAATIVTEYRNRLKQYNAIDFSLLLTETLTLLREYPDIYEQYHDRFRHVLVDEYQDVDRTQYYLHEALKPENVFVVGDHDQSIYHFRGSDIQIVLDFEGSHIGAEVLKLEQSYRCPSNVVEAANALIKHNPRRYDKTLWTENGAGTLKYNLLSTPEAEANWVIEQIKTLGLKPGDVAIISRTHNYQKAVVGALELAKIPYKLIGKQMKFWKTAGARLLISILKVMHNRKDEYNLKKLARTIVYGLTDVEILEYEKVCLQSGLRFTEVVMNKERGDFFDLCEWYDSVRDTKTVSLIEAASMALEKVDIAGYFLERNLYHKAQGFELLPQYIQQWEDENPGDQSVETFLGWLNEQDIQTEVDDSDKVKVATIHAVKGLEFPVVFVTGVNEGKLPHKRSIREGEVEEERRLCYVAVTRAKQHLFLSSIMNENVGEKSIGFDQSRFVNEMLNQ